MIPSFVANVEQSSHSQRIVFTVKYSCLSMHSTVSNVVSHSKGRRLLWNDVYIVMHNYHQMLYIAVIVGNFKPHRHRNL